MSRFDPASYWDQRYREGRDSGEGSRGAAGLAKATRVNEEIAVADVTSLADWGCGDGQVLRHLTPHVNYIGVDVSPTIINRLSLEFPDREFILADEATDIEVELALSMDVLFHFPEDDAYLAYLDKLFSSATRVVLIYSTNYDGGVTARHVRRRHFTADVEREHPQWRLISRHEHPTEAGFYTYVLRSVE